MPPKAKKELDEGELPAINRAVCKLRLVGDRENHVKRLSKIKARGVIPVTREKILEFAEANALYINPEAWDPKKKLPEGAQTVMTPELLIDLYKKFIKDQDLLGQRHKVLCLDAEKAGKEKPVDPRFVEDPKKVKKEPPKKKDPKAVEEPEEKELPEEAFDSSWEYTYVLFDDFETESELLALADLTDVVLLTVAVTGVEKARVTNAINHEGSRP
jgi:hypothetical protein